MSNGPSTLAVSDPSMIRFDGPSPEAAIAFDLVKRAIPLAPVMLILGGLIWGTVGVSSVGYGMAIILLNFLLAAGMLAGAARVSLSLMMVAALFGFLVRLGLVFVAVLLVKDAGWVDLVPLGITIIVTHLGLLAWETRYVSASLSFPGLKPEKSVTTVSVGSTATERDAS